MAQRPTESDVEETRNADPEERLTAALTSDVPQVYINGFVNMLGTADITTVLERNGRPVAILNMSYTVAKTFAVGLGQIIAILEDRAGREMLTTQEMEEKLKPAPGAQK